METKKKFSSPTALAVSPPKLTFHRRIARGAFGVVYLVSDDTGTQFAVKRSKKLLFHKQSIIYLVIYHLSCSLVLLICS
uniref:Protein kinase domain-containing protein n=1 Tax=Theileria annulata TaxID=5874 RepID=A0A3B0NA61_THEAN